MNAETARKKKLVTPGTWGSMQEKPISRQRVCFYIEEGRLEAKWVKDRTGRIGRWMIDPDAKIKSATPNQTKDVRNEAEKLYTLQKSVYLQGL